MERIAAGSPRSPWAPGAGAVADLVSPHLTPDRVAMVIESFVIARTSRCLQPPGDQKAVARLAELWERMSGTKPQGVNPVKYFLGGGAGLLGGLIVGYALQTVNPDLPLLYPLLIVGAVLGAVVAHYLRGTKTFEDCLLKLIINERRSVVRKEMVTDECEFWVPKALMWHRQGEWRRDRKGATYMWLHLPFRQRITERIRNMVDGLALPMDLYTALDSAIKGQRVWNRMLARNADDFAHLDDGEEPRKPIEEMMPHLLGLALVIGGLIFLMILAQ